MACQGNDRAVAKASSYLSSVCSWDVVLNETSPPMNFVETVSSPHDARDATGLRASHPHVRAHQVGGLDCICISPDLSSHNDPGNNSVPRVSLSPASPRVLPRRHVEKSEGPETSGGNSVLPYPEIHEHPKMTAPSNAHTYLCQDIEKNGPLASGFALPETESLFGAVTCHLHYRGLAAHAYLGR